MSFPPPPFTITKPRTDTPSAKYKVEPTANALLYQVKREDAETGYCVHIDDAETFLEEAWWVLVDEAKPPGVLDGTISDSKMQDSAPPLPGHDSLHALRNAWKADIHGDGAECPVCDRWGKVYDRTINETMADGLRWLYSQANLPGSSPRAWIDCPRNMPKELLRSNQHTTLRWWGLAERMEPEPNAKKRTKHSGMWRITLRGMDFIEGKLRVPKRVFTYNGEVVSSSNDDLVSIQQCGGGFSYEATMTTTHHAIGRSLFPANDSQTKAA